MSYFFFANPQAAVGFGAIACAILIAMYIYSTASRFFSNRRARQAAVRIKEGNPRGDYETAVFLLEQERAKKCKPMTPRTEPVCQVMSDAEVSTLQMESPEVTAANKKSLDDYLKDKRLAQKHYTSSKSAASNRVQSKDPWPKSDYSRHRPPSDRRDHVSFDLVTPIVVGSLISDAFDSSSTSDNSSSDFSGGGGDFGGGGSSGDY